MAVAEQRIAAATRVGQVAVPDTSSAGAIPQAVGRLADAIGSAGQSIHAADQRNLDATAQLDRQAQDAADQKLALAQSAALAQLHADEAVQAADLARAAAPGAGYQAPLAEWRQQRLAQFDAQFGDNERIRARFAEHVTRFDAESDANAHIAAIHAGAVQEGTDWSTTADTLQNVVRSTPTLEKLNEARSLAATALANLHNLTPEQRAAAAADIEPRLWAAMTQGMLDSGQDQALGQIVSAGGLDTHLDPQTLGRVRGQVAAAGEARQVAAEQAASDARRAVTDEYDALKLRIDAGELPPARDIDAMIARARAAGLPPDDLTRIGLLGEDVAVNRQYANVDTGTLTGLQARLSATPIDRLSPAQQRLLHRLPGMITARTDTEVAPLRAQWQQGGAARAQVAAQVAATPNPQDRFRRGEAIAPGLGYLMGVRTNYQARAIDGQALIDHTPALAPPAVVNSNFRDAVGGEGNVGALRLLSADAQAATRSIATSIYIGWGSRFDEAGNPTNTANWRGAINAALGGTGPGVAQQGGLVNWHGRNVIAPPSMTPEQFGRAIGGHDFSDARTSDGRAPNVRHVLDGMVPVLRGMDGNVAVYRMMTPDGRSLKTADGRDYDVRIGG